MKKDGAAFTCCDATEMLCETIDGFEDRLIDSPNKSQLASWFRSTPQYDLRTVLYDGNTAFLEIRPRYEGFAFSFLEAPRSKPFRLDWEQIFRHCRASYVQ